jgi:4,5-dihydroxyphthalate decarboxylase
MKLTIRLALRDWDYMTPLALGDVTSERLDLKLDRVAALPEDLATDLNYDAGEMSLSRYTTARARGETAVFGVPNFIMRGFRHRCVITARHSPLTRLADLHGRRIGLAGWQDSGNTWTRAALAHEGVGIEDAEWIVGRLAASHPSIDRVGRYARPGRIETIQGDPPILDLLLEGKLDAVFTPFMPAGFYGRAAKYRHLVTDLRATERAYFETVGYVPGIHILGIKADLVRQHPWLAQELSDLLDASQRMWLDKRRRYAETTPWIIDELGQSARDLPETWDASGLEPNRHMIAAFIAQARHQHLMDAALTPDTLFPATPA